MERKRVTKDYRAKGREIETERRAFEQRLSALSEGEHEKTAQVEALLPTAAGARYAFESGSIENKREVLLTVLLNAQIKGGDIASYQLKRPSESFRWTPPGRFVNPGRRDRTLCEHPEVVPNTRDLCDRLAYVVVELPDYTKFRPSLQA